MIREIPNLPSIGKGKTQDPGYSDWVQSKLEKNKSVSPSQLSVAGLSMHDISKSDPGKAPAGKQQRRKGKSAIVEESEEESDSDDEERRKRDMGPFETFKKNHGTKTFEMGK
jgi:hypothetical protein